MSNVRNYVSNFLRSDNKKVITIIRLAVVASILCTFGIVISAFTTQAHAAASCSNPYKVKAGDTLSQIASRYNANWHTLAADNNIANANLIYVNQQICISNTHKAIATHVAPAINSAPIQASTPKPNVNVASTDVNGLIDEIFGSYAASAKSVAMCESGMNPNATNPSSNASGVFQILYPSTWNTTTQAGQSPYNAQANITAAHEIFVRDGYSWREWSCQP
jgi:LysM repeat protein